MGITSVHNPLLKKIRKALAAGRQTEDGLVVAEGPHLVEEALTGVWPFVQVLTTPAGRSKHAELLQRTNVEIVEVSSRAFESITGTQHSQQILALLKPATWEWTDLMKRKALIIALDRIQDPGNAGTIVRSAEAFGGTGLVFLEGSAHVANGKLLRASTGSILRMPFLDSAGSSEFLLNVQASGLALYALDARAEVSITAADLARPLALIVGNEGSGVSPELLSPAKAVSIPTTQVESVNAAVACSVALFVAQQQRNAS